MNPYFLYRPVAATLESFQFMFEISGKYGRAIMAIMILLLLPEAVRPQSMYWDINGATNGAGGPSPTGTWGGTTPNWTTDPTGSSPTITWSSGDTAIFSADSDATNSYMITLSGTQTASGVTFATGVATLTNGTLNLNGTGTISVSAAPIKGLIASPITGSVGLTKVSSGELVLSGANAFTGNLTNVNGTLTLNSDQAGGGGSIVLNPVSLVALHSSQALTVLTNNIALGVLHGGSASIEIDADTGNTLALGGILSGSRAWSANGKGTLVLSNDNTFSGTLTVQQGTLVASQDDALGNPGSANVITVNSGATLALQGGIDCAGNAGGVKLNGNGVGGGAALNNVSGDNQFEGEINLNANSSIGATSGSLELNQPVGGAGYSLVIVGTGELDLAGSPNNYNNTTVSQGTLGIVSPANAGNGTVTVNSGATLLGNGSAPGGVVVNGTIYPDGGFGFSFIPDIFESGSESWNGGGAYTWEINDTAGAAGSGYSEVDVTNSSLTINAASINPFTINLVSLDPGSQMPGLAAGFDNTQSNSWVLATASGGISGFSPGAFLINTSGFENPMGNGAFIVQQSGNDLLLSFVQKPLITTGPVNQTVDQCTNVTFTVTATGSGTLHYQWFFNSTPVGTDSPMYSVSDVSFAQGGTYSVTVSNLSGYTATSSATLAVLDPPPIIVGLPANITTNTSTDPHTVGCSQDVYWVAPGVADNCPGASLTTDHPIGSSFPVGVTTVNYIASDSIGQKTTNSFTVTVVDKVQPLAVFNSISVQLDGTGNYTLTGADVAAIAAGSSDACAALNYTNVSPNTFTYCDAGAPKLVTLTLTDTNGNTTVTNSTITVLAPTNPPAMVYVDASYGACNGAVTFPRVGGAGEHYIGFDAFTTVQGGVNGVATNGTVTVAAGTYSEGVNITKPLSLLGANQGVAGCGSRSSESTIKGGAGNAISITTSNVLVDGFTLQGAMGVVDSGGAGVAIQNNTISTTTGGVEASAVVTSAGAGLTVQNNCISLLNQVTGGIHTVGVGLNTISGTQAPLIVSNNVQGAFYGYLLYGLNAASPTVVSSGTISGTLEGVAVWNLNPATLTSFSSSLFGVSSVTMSGFSGSDPNAPEAGVYVFTYGSDSTALVTGTITNVSVTGVGNVSSDSSGVDLADFSTSAGARQNITVVNSTIFNNQNRGVFVSGTNVIVNVTGSTILGNGYNSVTGNGNYGFGIIARNNAQMTVANCFISNPATSLTYVYALEIDANTPAQGPVMTVTNCSILNNGNPAGYLAKQSDGTLNASGNWWGSTNDATIAALVVNVVDFNPYLDSGTDTDAGTPGFQGDFSTLHVTTLGAQTGATGRVQEGINDVTAKGTVFVQPGTYVESPVIPAEISLVGSGNGIDPGTAAIINGGANAAITVTGSGAAANDRLTIAYLQLTGAYGIYLNSAISNITLSGVSVLGCANAGVELHNTANVNNLSLSGCYLENNPIGLRTATSAQLVGLSMQGGIISGGIEGIYINQNTSPPFEVCDNVTINGTLFSGNSLKGIYAETLSDAVLENLTFNNCGASGSFGAGININEKHAAYQNVMITNCDFTGCGTGDSVNGAAVVIEARDDGSYSAVPATLTGVALAGLNISGSPDAIRFGEPGKNNAGPLNVSIHDCSLISCVSNGVRNASLATVGAVSNWWGSVSGPSGTANPYGTGTGVSGLVNFAPWLGDGTDTSVAVGFQPNTSPTFLPPSQLVFSTEPGGANLGGSLSPQPVVQIEDSSGNLTPWANPLVTCSITNNPGGGVLTGSNPAQAVGGIASFNNLAVTVGGGSGYTLAASAPYLTTATSTGFDVANPVPGISGLNPFYIRAGGTGFSLAIAGTDFVPASVVHWNGGTKTTHFVSSTQVTADISASDIASIGTAQVYVSNPVPGGGNSGQLTFRIVAATPTVTYVDHNYTSQPANTQVNWPYTDTGTNIIGYDAFATVQGGVAAVASGGNVNVAGGNYAECDLLTKPVNLLGANVGVAGCGVRTQESYINAGTGTAITVLSSNVVVDGFELGGTNGVVDAGFSGVAIQNNAINAGAVGVEALNIATANGAGFTVQNNCISLQGQLAGFTPTVGIGLDTFTGTQTPLIESNNVQGAAYGYLLYGMNTAVPSVVDGGTISGAVQGVAAVNRNPLAPASYNSSTVSVSDMGMSGFTGTYPNFPQAGVYVYTSSSNLAAVITGTISNLSVTGVGNVSPDCAGVNLADFTTNSVVMQNISIVNCDIYDNANRGIAVSGTNAVATVIGSTITGNGSNPYGLGGNPGFGIIARNNSQVTVENCFIANPAAVTAPYTVTAVEADANVGAQGPTLVVMDCSILNNGNASGKLAGQSAGTLNASGNWWGTASDTIITNYIAGIVDFTPYLDSGKDTDVATAGFQGDFSVLHVTALGSQTGGSARVQEGVNNATGPTPAVIVQAGTYAESVVINRAGLTLKSAQNAGVTARGPRNAESIMASTDANGTIQIAADNVTVDGMNTVAASTAYGVNVEAGVNNAMIINAITGNGNVGVGVSGSATIEHSVASSPANGIGILASGASARALVQDDDLAGDSTAGIEATGGAAVDAGGCSGDITGLGSSSGANDLSGYLSGPAKAVINNASTVRAYDDSFGATALSPSIATGFSGVVPASQSGGILAIYPGDQSLQCAASIPPGATNLSTFAIQGGVVSATVADIAYSDSVVSNAPNNLTITRTYTVSDACSQSAQSTQTITVDDTMPPMFTVCASPVTNAADTNGYALMPDLTGSVTVSENCNGYILNQIPVPNTPEFLGAHPVVIWAIDSDGNSNSCSTSFTVLDVTAPTLSCAPDVTVTTSQDKDPYAAGSPMATDASGSVTIAYSDDDTGLTNCDTTGLISRKWTATDSSGNQSVCTQTITVTDTNAPYFTYLPADMTLTNDPGQCGAVVNFEPVAEDLGYFQGFEATNWTSGDANSRPSTDWNDYYSHVSYATNGTDGITANTGNSFAVIDSTGALPDDSTGAFSRLGGYSSVFGNGFRVSQDVYINLQDPGVVNATPSAGYAWDLSVAVNDQTNNNLRDFVFHAAAYDASGVVIAAGNGSDDSVLPHTDIRTGNYSTIASSGWYTFQWIFRNTNNVLAVDLSVKDTNGVVLFTQTLSNPGDLISSVVGGHRYLWFTFINADSLAIDNTKLERDELVDSTMVSGAEFPVGTTVVTNTTLDACGNSTSATFAVTVLDQEPPHIPAIANIIVTNTLGNCTVPVNYAPLDVTDNCGVLSTTFTPDDGSSFGIGVTPVTVVAEDIHGNFATTNFNVTVIDTTASTLATSLTPQVYGQGITLTATISACPAQPTTGGTVTFYDGTNSLGTGLLGSIDVNGTATAALTVSNLTVGDHNLTAAYAGDALHLASTSDVQVQAITLATLTVSGITANDKTYDGNASAGLNVGGAILNGVYFNDPVVLNAGGATGTFSDKNIGTNKTVYVSGLTITGPAAFNYKLVQPTSTANIAAKVITITANNASKTYGGTVTFTGAEFTTTTMVAGESVASVTLSSAGAVSNANAGTYDIVPVNAVGALGTDLANYSITYANGTLTVNVVALSITANSTSKVYGQNVEFDGAEFTSSGLTNGDQVSSVTLVSDGAGTNANVGAYDIVPSLAQGINPDNYDITYHHGTLTVNPALLAITANDTNRIYGTTNPVLTVTYAGFVNGQSTSLVTGAPTLSCDVATNASVGIYSNAITVVDAGDLYATNYTFAPLTSTNGTLTVATAQLVPGIAAADKVYDGTINVTLTASNLAGVVGTDDVILVVGNVGFSDANVGNGKTVTATGLTLGGAQATNYVLTTTTAITTASITAEALLVTANDDSKTYDGVAYGGGNGVTYAGFVNGETNTVLGGALSYVGTAQGAANAGSYSITPQGLTSANYDISFAEGTLTINQAMATVAADPQSKTFGATNPVLTATVIGQAPAGDAINYSLATTATAASVTGIYPITVALGSNPNYSVTSSNSVLTVNPATPLLNISSATAINYGQPLSASTISGTASNPNNSANVPGTFAFTSPGDVPVTTTSQAVTFTPFDNTDYTIASGSVIVPVTDPAILAQPVSVTNALGGRAAFSVTVSGTPVLAYQWLQNGTPLPGDTASNLVISVIKDSDAGNYTVIISNSVNVVTSSVAVLAVTHPPVIVTQPLSLVVTQGVTTNFTVSANGTTPFTYQWLKNGIPLSNVGNVLGATEKKLILSSVTGSDSGTYSVLITNADGNVASSNATLTVIVPPAITGQPQSLTNNAGTVAVLSVTNTGSPSVYRWFKNGITLLTDGVKISGSSTPTLTISNVLGVDGAVYSVVVSNAAAAVTSSNALLVVIDPIITSQPISVTTNLGSPASFTVAAYGTAPQYQWLKNGAAISGATVATYAISSVADTDAAAYSVIVSNQFGIVTSAPPAVLTVIDPPIVTHGPQSLTVNATSNATFTVLFTGTSPAIQWLKNGVPLVNGGNVSGATLSTLTLANVHQIDAAGYTVVLSNAANVVTSTPAALLTVIDPPFITQEPVSVTNNAGTVATFTVSYTGTAPAFQWYKNGGLLGNGANVTGATSATLTVSNVQDSDAAAYTICLANAAGVVTSAPPAMLTVIDPPVVSTAPNSRTNNAGTTATFTVVYTGTSPAFQWLKNGNPLGNGGNVSGATTSTLTLANVQDADAAGYAVILSNAAGTVTSTPPAYLTVIDPPSITQQPVSITNTANTTATFAVLATGTAPAYQWYKNGTNALIDGGNVSGAHSSMLTLSNVFGIDGAVYSVVLSNAAGVLVSTGATLTVVDPIITMQPVGVTNIDGSTVVFSVTAVGTAALSYQWYQDGDILDGETAGTLTLNNIADSDAGEYTVVITNSYGSVTSTPAMLVTIPPLIVNQPASLYAFVGESVSFSVGVNGETPFSYQWTHNGTNVMGATSRILSIPNVALTDAGVYQVGVANPIGGESSRQVSLTVYTSTNPILSIVYPPNGNAVVRLDGLPMFKYAIQGSSNLLDWVTIQTNNAPFSIIDTNGGQPAYFYRGLYLP